MSSFLARIESNHLKMSVEYADYSIGGDRSGEFGAEGGAGKLECLHFELWDHVRAQDNKNGNGLQTTLSIHVNRSGGWRSRRGSRAV